MSSEELKPCPVCGCEERGQGGYLRCECPSPTPASTDEVSLSLIDAIYAKRVPKGYPGWIRELVDEVAAAMQSQLTAAQALIEQQRQEIERLRVALKPFAQCVEQINASESDEEWAKFRLLIKDYRRAQAALEEKP
jgi:hypothetical protein